MGTEGGGSDIRLQLEPGGVEVSGNVVDVTGGFVAGALITARAGSSEFFSTALSDVGGRFRLSVPEGSVELEAEANSYSLGHAAASAPAHGLILALVPASALVGRVESEGAEAPIAGATVTAANTDGMRAKSRTAHSATDGTFRFDGLPAGLYELEAVAREWRSERQLVSVGVGQTMDELVMTAFRATTLSGSVDVAGEPCPSAYLEASGPVSSFVRGRADGTLLLEGLPPGQYHLTIGSLEPGHEPFSEELYIGEEPLTRTWSLEPASPEESQPQTACCKPSGTIRAVVVAEETSLGTTPAPMVTSDQWAGHGPALRGKFRGEDFVFAELELGSYEVFLEQSPETRQRVTLQRNGQLAVVTLEAPPRTQISGHVLDDESLPVADAWVHAKSLTAKPGTRGELPTLTDSEGAFTIPRLFPGRYAIRVESGAWRAELDDVPAGTQGIALRITAHGSLTGEVTNASGERESFSLVYRRMGSPQVHETVGLGTWSLPWIPAGDYQLVVFAESGIASEEVKLEPGADLQVALLVTPANSTAVPEWVREHPRWGDLGRAHNK
jgi:hypothetical protein